MNTSYDTIGVNYSDLRKPDPRIEGMIGRALGSAKTVLNVGAGAGSYEPADRQVTAIEPSMEMIQQRPASAASVIQGQAEDLPFDDNSFDASRDTGPDRCPDIRPFVSRVLACGLHLGTRGLGRSANAEDDGLRGVARAGRNFSGSNSA